MAGKRPNPIHQEVSQKRNIARTMLVIISVATLYLGLVPAVQAADHCSNTKAAGR
jgi:hypothetical protein